MYSDDLRWRVVSLIHIYGCEVDFLSDIFGPNPRSIHRWYEKFLKAGTVRDNLPVLRQSRWPREVIAEVEKYVKAHPTFYIEELKDHIYDQNILDLETHLILLFVESLILIYNCLEKN